MPAFGRLLLLPASLLIALGCQSSVSKQSLFNASTPIETAFSAAPEPAGRNLSAPATPPQRSVWADLNTRQRDNTSGNVTIAAQAGRPVAAAGIVTAGGSLGGPAHSLPAAHLTSLPAYAPRTAAVQTPRQQQAVEVARLLTALVQEDNGLLPSETTPAGFPASAQLAQSIAVPPANSSRNTNTLAARQLASLVADPAAAPAVLTVSTAAPQAMPLPDDPSRNIQLVSATQPPSMAPHVMAMPAAQAWEIQRLAQETAMLSQRVDALMRQPPAMLNQLPPAAPAAAEQSDLQLVKRQLQELLNRMEQQTAAPVSQPAAPARPPSELATLAAELALIAERFNAERPATEPAANGTPDELSP